MNKQWMELKGENALEQWGDKREGDQYWSESTDSWRPVAMDVSWSHGYRYRRRVEVPPDESIHF